MVQKIPRGFAVMVVLAGVLIVSPVVSIASRYKISAYTLMLDNHIANPNLIFPGQVLCIR